MRRAGFVLVGGRSSRMGRDKALLPFRGATLAEFVAREVEAAAGSVALIGPPERYRQLPFPVYPDLLPECGPLGGIVTALTRSEAEWNLIVACDMPGITMNFFEELLTAAETDGAECRMPVGPSGRPEPLCAVWRRGCLSRLQQAAAVGNLKVTLAAATLNLHYHQVSEPAWFRNLNTPEEWAVQEGTHA